MEYNDNLDLYKFIYESHLNSLISIYKDIEIVSNNKIVEIENEIKKLSLANSNKHISIFNLSDEMFDDYSHYNYHIHYNLMNSLFISAFSLFENHISKIAEIATKKYKPLIRINV